MLVGESMMIQSSEAITLLLKEKILTSYNNQDYLSALDYCIQLQGLTKLDNRDYYLMGLIYEKLLRLAEAAKCFYVALRKAPNTKKYLDKYKEFMSTHYSEQEFFNQLKKLITTKPQRTHDLQVLFIDYVIKKKQYAEALTIALETNLFHPNSPEVLKS